MTKKMATNLFYIHRISEVVSMDVESSDEVEKVRVGPSDDVEESEMSMLRRN